MPLTNTRWYVKDGSGIGWSGVTAWAASTSYSVGALRRQNSAPTAGNERIFVCVVAGTSGGSEPTWTVTKGAKTTDNTVTWQECTGQPAVNGDVTNTQPWDESQATSLGLIIKNIAATHYFICDTSSGNTGGSEPSWDTTAGNTTNDGSNVWRCLGAVGGFSAWGAPHRRIANAAASGWAAPGDRVFVSHVHDYSTSASYTPFGTSAGTAAAPEQFICVNDGAAPPATLATTAKETTTGASTITIEGFPAVYGIHFKAATTGNINIDIGTSANPHGSLFEECIFEIGTTSSVSEINIGQAASASNDDSTSRFRNCDFRFANASQNLDFGAARISMVGCGFADTGSVPTTLFTIGAARVSVVEICDSDLSNVTGTIIDLAAASPSEILLKNCKLGSGVTPVSGTIPGPGGGLFRMHNCDSGNVNYRLYEKDYYLTVQSETSVVRTGGATDGTTSISWSIIPTASVSLLAPGVVQMPISIWNETTGSSITAEIYLASSVSLTDLEFWVEFEYLGTSGFPLGVIASTRGGILSAGTTLTTDGVSSWGGSPANTYKVSASFTPQMKAFIQARICIAKTTGTIYVDPKIVISGNAVDRAYLAQGQGVVNTFSGGSGTTIVVPNIVRNIFIGE